MINIKHRNNCYEMTIGENTYTMYLKMIDGLSWWVFSKNGVEDSVLYMNFFNMLDSIENLEKQAEGIVDYHNGVG